MFEHEFNLDISNRIRAGIKDSVFVVFTREDEHDISLEERVVLANSFTKAFDKLLYVSVHANAGGGTGWEVFTSKGETKSDEYATVFYNEMKKEFPDMKFRKDTLDGDVDKEANFYVLKHTNMAAVLTENFFMDTLKPDCELIMSDEGRQKIADAHIRAILTIVKIWNNE